MFRGLRGWRRNVGFQSSALGFTFMSFLLELGYHCQGVNAIASNKKRVEMSWKRPHHVYKPSPKTSNRSHLDNR